MPHRMSNAWFLAFCFFSIFSCVLRLFKGGIRPLTSASSRQQGTPAALGHRSPSGTKVQIFPQPSPSTSPSHALFLYNPHFFIHQSRQQGEIQRLICPKAEMQQADGRRLSGQKTQRAASAIAPHCIAHHTALREPSHRSALCERKAVPTGENPLSTPHQARSYRKNTPLYINKETFCIPEATFCKVLQKKMHRDGHHSI